METNINEWKSVDNAAAHTPSPDFVLAVAELLETDADDILAELGYTRQEVAETVG